MKYLFLILTIIIESAAVIFMKLSDGFSHKLYAAAAIIFYALSFVFLTPALRHLPAGIANAVWAGASTVLVAVAGIIIFKEQLSWLQVLFLAMIVAGIAGLNWKAA